MRAARAGAAADDAREPSEGRSEQRVGQARALLEEALGLPFFEGNRLEVLRNGVEIFPAMLRAIERSTSSIDFLTFVYWRGEIADRMAHALAERARAGVRTRVLLDAVGARPMEARHRRMLEASGAQVAWLRPLARWKLWQADHRTHRKILVCDRRVAFTGGVGIADEWQGDARDPSEWRETHFEVRGPAVRGLQGGFVDNWLEARRSGFPSPSASPPSDGDPGRVPIQVVRSSARIGWSDATTLLHTLLGAARRRIRITTAYFAPDALDRAALVEAVRRGVSVQVLVPGPHVDSRLSQLAGEDGYDELLEGGIEIFRYQPTMLHAKVMTCDGLVAAVGSPNFNQRSMNRDDEIALNVVDPPTVEVLDRQLRDDLARAEPIRPGRWRRRGLWQRAKERVARTLRPEV